ncbi:MAG: hypothetical protein WBE18_03870 [Gammaproteobacteria bacterium]
MSANAFNTDKPSSAVTKLNVLLKQINLKLQQIENKPSNNFIISQSLHQALTGMQNEIQDALTNQLELIDDDYCRKKKIEYKVYLEMANDALATKQLPRVLTKENALANLRLKQLSGVLVPALEEIKMWQPTSIQVASETKKSFEEEIKQIIEEKSNAKANAGNQVISKTKELSEEKIIKIKEITETNIQESEEIAKGLPSPLDTLYRDLYRYRIHITLCLCLSEIPYEIQSKESFEEEIKKIIEEKSNTKADATIQVTSETKELSEEKIKKINEIIEKYVQKSDTIVKGLPSPLNTVYCDLYRIRITLCLDLNEIPCEKKSNFNVLSKDKKKTPSLGINDDYYTRQKDACENAIKRAIDNHAREHKSAITIFLNRLLEIFKTLLNSKTYNSMNVTKSSYSSAPFFATRKTTLQLKKLQNNIEREVKKNEKRSVLPTPSRSS